MPVDYSPSLGKITKALSEMSRLLAQINEHPALAMTPAVHQQIISDSGRVVMRDAVGRLNHAAQWAERTQHELAAIVGTARQRQQQVTWLLIAAALALCAGFLAAPFVARGLPIGLQTRMAAAVMGADRWDAGSALMEVDNPEAWHEILSAGAFLKSNRAALEACRESASKARQPKPCTVTVTAPSRP